MKTICLATDHAGFELKETVKAYLAGRGFEIVDVGAHEFDPQDDYPGYMAAAASRVAEDASGETAAIVFGGSGNGEAIVCNRYPGVRAAVWYGGTEEIVRLSRQHNDANVLSIGARFVKADEVKSAVTLWLDTPFSGEDRHARRIRQIDATR